jgi:hypothetical protein
MELPPQTEPVAAQVTPTSVVPGVPTTCQGENYGTAVTFLNNPKEASREAQREQKLLFVLHISGNFEDSQFT